MLFPGEARQKPIVYLCFSAALREASFLSRLLALEYTEAQSGV
jgi:hypothetical protein